MDDTATPAELLETRLLDWTEWTEGRAYFCCIFAMTFLEICLCQFNVEQNSDC